MSKKSRAKRSKRVTLGVFRAVAARLTEYSESYSNLVICPLCRREFSESQIGELSRDHIVPEALGGSTTAVTCQKCNNVFGSRAEGHLSKPFHLARHFESETGLTGKLTVGEHSFAASIMKPKNPATGLQIKTLGGSPKAFAGLHESMAKGVLQEWSFRHEVSYRSDRAMTAIAKAAYLAVFRDFGYQFVFSGAGETVRSELVAARDGRSQVFQPLISNLAKVHRLTGTEPEFATFRLQIADYRLTFALILFQSGLAGYWTFVLMPDVEDYPEGTFASRTLFDYLGDAKKLLGPYYIQMQGDDTGVTALRLFNPIEDVASETVYIGPRR